MPEVETLFPKSADGQQLGLLRGLSFEDYRKIEAINSGALKWMKVSPKHGAAYLAGEIDSPDTVDRRLGRAIHSMLLEPETYATRFPIAQPCCAILASGKNKGMGCGNAPKAVTADGRWACGQHYESMGATFVDEFVTVDEAWRIDRIAVSLHDHPVMPMFKRAGWSEVSLVWEYKGLTLKGRIDRYCEGSRPVIMDLKSMQVGAGSRGDLQKSIINNGYHRQLALYAHGVKALTGTMPEVVLIFIEKDVPFDVNVIPFTPDDIAAGWHEANAVLNDYAVCKEAGKFPGYIRGPFSIHPGACPEWYMKSFYGAGIV